MNGSPVAWGKPGDGKWCNTAKVLLISMVCKRSVPMKILHSHKGCFFPTENTDPCQGFFPFSLSLIFFSASWGFRECTLSVFPRESGSTPPQFFILLLKAVSFPLPTHMHIQVQNKSVSIMSCAMSFPIRLYSSLHCTWRHIHIWLISTDLRVQTETSTFFNLGLVLRFFFCQSFHQGQKWSVPVVDYPNEALSECPLQHHLVGWIWCYYISDWKKRTVKHWLSKQ